MLKFLVEFLTLALATLLPLAVLFYHLSSETMLQISAGLLVLLLLIINRFYLARAKPISYSARIFLIFITATFLQVLILSTGGFQSPFFILIYLFALGLSLLMRFRIALIFLLFSAAGILVNNLINQKLFDLITADPWTTVLYVLSFVAVLPLYQYVSDRYHFKDTLAQLLSSQLSLTSSQLKLAEKSQELILGGLTDLVIITNSNLEILSVNEPATQVLGLTSFEIIGSPLFQILNLKDLQGKAVDVCQFPIEKILNEGTTQRIGGLFMSIRSSDFPIKVRIKIRPITNIEGKIDQLVFIISGGFGVSGAGIPLVIEQSALKFNSILEGLKDDVEKQRLSNLRARFELLGRINQDILTYLEIEDSGVKPKIILMDVAELAFRVADSERKFAQSLDVPLEVTLDQSFREKFTSFSPQRDFPSVLSAQYFSAPVDLKWLGIILRKLLDISILLTSKTTSPNVNLLIECHQGSIEITISGFSPRLPSVPKQVLFQQSPESLTQQLGLSLGSGLESSLVKAISTSLNIPITFRYQEELSIVSYSLHLSKNPTK